MWAYIPNQDSASSPSAQEPGDLTSEYPSLAQALERCVTWRSKCSTSRYWLTRLHKVPWMTRLSGRIYEASMQNRGAAEWIASLPASPVSRTRLPATEKERKTKGGSGPTLLESFAILDAATSSWRTSQPSLIQDLIKSSVIWPKRGSMRNGICFPRLRFPRLTKGKGYSSWPTVRVAINRTSRDSMYPEDHNHWSAPGLEQVAEMVMGDTPREMWSTPDTQPEAPNSGLNRGKNHGGSRRRIKQQGLGNQATGKDWPTPDASPDRGSNRRYTEGDIRTGRMLKQEAQNWPSPRAEDSESCGNHPEKQDSLTGATSLWATPSSHDGRRETDTSSTQHSNLQLEAQSWEGAEQCSRVNSPQPTLNGFEVEGQSAPQSVMLATHTESDKPTDLQNDQWPSPAARDHRTPNSQSYRDRGGADKGEQLPNYVEHKWGTPRVTTNGGVGQVEPSAGSRIEDQAKNWQTPRTGRGKFTRDHGQKGSERLTLEGSASLHRVQSIHDGRELSEKDLGSPLRLNPRFVEWLMGWPIGFTEMR